MMSRTKHVALVGMTGVGKSTLVNLLKGEEVAATNNNVRPCTTRTTSYDVVDPERGSSYCIWDTRGLNEASEQDILPVRVLKSVGILLDAERELKKFLRGKNPQISLVVLCVDARKIKVPVHWKIYNKIYADFCKRSIRVVVVATQMGDEDILSSKWKKTVEDAARGVEAELPSRGLMEAVPKFDELDEPKVKACKAILLRLLSSV